MHLDYQTLFESCPGLYLVLSPDPNFTIVAASQAYLSATMTRREEIMGRGIFEVFPDNPDDPEATGTRNLRASLERVVRDQMPDTMAVQKYDIRRPESEGGGFEERYWSPLNSPVLGPDGKVILIVHRVEDVTEFVRLKHQRVEQTRLTDELRLRAERMESEIYLRAQELQRMNKALLEAKEAAEAANTTKSRFFENISHELRTPLTLILAPVEKMLSEGTNLTEPQRHDLGVVQRNAAILLRHVSQLLDASKLEAGKMSMNYARVDLAALVRLIAGYFDALAPQRGIGYSIDTPRELLADADAEKIEHLLLNLLSNAFKFVPDGGMVSVTLRSVEGNQAMITVQDDGEGVKPEYRDAIFDRFSRGEDASARPLGGTGLGLAIAKDFVIMHGGSIDVVDAPGGGALFRVWLPLAAAPGTPVRTSYGSVVPSVVEGEVAGVIEQLRPPVTASVSATTPDSQKPTVVVVEDNPEMSRIVAESLPSDCRVVTAANGLDGLRKVRQLIPDLIISDIKMPVMSGDAMIREIRSTPNFDEIPVLVLSARADDELRIQLLRGYVQDYVLKPFSAAELAARARNLLSIKRSKDALKVELSSKSQDLESMAREMAARKRELETVSRLKDEFLATLSHELRTPLTSIYGWIRLLRSTSLSETQLQSGMETIERNAEAQMALIEDLLDVSRITIGKLKVEIEVVDFAEVIREAVQSSQLAAEAKQLTVDVKLDSGTYVQGDFSRLRQVMFNLLNNAVKFTPEGGRVEVMLKRTASTVEVSVTDSGDGIDAEFLPYVFDPFRQKDGSSTRHQGGLGIGLAIVKSLVELHGGQVQATSEGEGKGATFLIRLPLVADVLRFSPASKRTKLWANDL